MISSDIGTIRPHEALISFQFISIVEYSITTQDSDFDTLVLLTIR